MAIGSLFHKAESAVSNTVSGVAHVAKGAVDTVSDATSSVVHKASSAAEGLYDSGKAGLSSVSKAVGKTVDNLEDKGEHLAASATHALKQVAAPVYHHVVEGVTDIAGVASKAFHKAEDVVPGLRGAVNLGEKGLHKLGDLGGDALHKVADKGPLHGVVDYADKMITGHNFLSKEDQAADHKVTEEVARAVQGDHPKDMSSLIKQVEGIKDDQTRIETISKMYGIQANQMSQALGVKGESSWSGWANQAAGLVGDVHGGDKGITSIMGRLSGADDELAKGNKKVFTDIAPVTNSFVNSVDKFQTGGKFDQGKFDQWWDAQSKEMKASSANDPKFKQGFEDYAQAKYATNTDNQHAWMTAGTVRMAQHEQAELQPEIAASMHGGIVGKVVNGVADVAKDLPFHQINPASSAADTGRSVANKGAGILSTQLVGGVSMGGGNTLDISQDVVGPGGKSVPDDIANSTGAARAEIEQAALDSHTTLGQVQGTGATDYSNLDQRLRVLTANIIAYGDTTIPNR